MTRTVTTDVNAILRIAMLTDEEQGTTGALIREYLYDLLGGLVTDEEIAGHVKSIIDRQIARSGKTAEILRAEWEAREAKKPAHKRRNAEEDEREEDAYHTCKVTEVVTMMREGR